MKIAKKYIHQSGKHAGHLNQKLLQTPGKFKYRDPHPTIKGLYLLNFSHTFKHPQRWAVISKFPKLTGIVKINQQALQVPGTFKPGDPHPTAKNMVYHCLAGSKRGQRWETVEQRKIRLSKIASNAKTKRINRTPEQIAKDKIRNKKYYKKFWANPILASQEKQRRKERRANRTPEQIKIDQEKGKAHRKANREAILKAKKEEYERNKDSYIKRSCTWNKVNKKRRNEIISNYHQAHKDEPQYKILQLLRARFYKGVIKQQKGKKACSTKNIIGCTIKQLRKYLESKFDKDMSWSNFGLYGWHIDHIVPCSSFDLTKPSEQKKCFHYTNLQPLWAHDNLRKSNKLNWQKAA